VPSSDSETQDKVDHDTDLLLPSVSFMNEKQSPLPVTAQQGTSLVPPILSPTQDASGTAATTSKIWLSPPVNRRGIQNAHLKLAGHATPESIYHS